MQEKRPQFSISVVSRRSRYNSGCALNIQQTGLLFFSRVFIAGNHTKAYFVTCIHPYRCRLYTDLNVLFHSCLLFSILPPLTSRAWICCSICTLIFWASGFNTVSVHLATDFYQGGVLNCSHWDQQYLVDVQSLRTRELIILFYSRIQMRGNIIPGSRFGEIRYARKIESVLSRRVYSTCLYREVNRITG